MDQRRSADRPLREPIRHPWLWVGLALSVLAGIPLYLAPGLVRPLVFGIPAWLAVSVLATLAFAALTSWMCLRWWNLAEPAEEAARAEDRSAA
ncbi:hypothetical protein GCM10027271_21750 [Saccharopolyspora gloriosae]|uniref:DUF3311 domain-containing protein n=1 Tax=Saccharopolyspora gloriosae TaxID=455344 RepID=A0A840NGX8_9PSEU|nr:hypothetical protein [Saccharopolyspora gloriosae]MBB5070844.1 hypothetical protein [Saccharopolyspora gloriosae]